MLMRKKGYIEGGQLFVSNITKGCSYDAEGAACGLWCAAFDTIEDDKGKVIGAYLGCIDKEWAFISEASE